MDIIELINAFKQLVEIANEHDQLPDNIYKLAEKLDPKFIQQMREENCGKAGGHEYDSDSGYMCINCDKDGTEDLIDAAEARMEDR